MQLVIVESPYAGEIARNIAYARLALSDCLSKGEAPFASHLLYTQPLILDDEVPEERDLGIRAGFQWRKAAEKTVVYQDFGITDGMQWGIDHAIAQGLPVEYRNIEKHYVTFLEHSYENARLPGWT